MKTLQGLKGVKELSKNEQKSLNGGKMQCLKSIDGAPYCPTGWICIKGTCEHSPIDPYEL